MFRYIQRKYQFTDYQIAQLKFLFLTLFSELSKTFLIGILFIHELPIFIWCLFIFQLMRTSTGGIHFKRYVSCLCMSIFFFFMCIDILPLIPIDKTVELVLLVICAYISYIIGPVVSAIHLELSPESITASKNRLMYVVFGYSVFLFIMPQYRFISVGFWVIIFNTVMLVIAKIKSQMRGGETMIRKLNKTVAGIFTCMMSISLWIGSSFPCILFFGEYEYPRKEDYED